MSLKADTYRRVFQIPDDEQIFLGDYDILELGCVNGYLYAMEGHQTGRLNIPPHIGIHGYRWYMTEYFGLQPDRVKAIDEIAVEIAETYHAVMLPMLSNAVPYNWPEFNAARDAIRELYDEAREVFKTRPKLEPQPQQLPLFATTAR
jgi:hypothetical protein